MMKNVSMFFIPHWLVATNSMPLMRWNFHVRKSIPVSSNVGQHYLRIFKIRLQNQLNFNQILRWLKNNNLKHKNKFSWKVIYFSYFFKIITHYSLSNIKRKLNNLIHYFIKCIIKNLDFHIEKYTFEWIDCNFLS